MSYDPEGAGPLTLAEVDLFKHQLNSKLLQRFIATIDHQAEQLAAARKALENASKMCTFCWGSNVYWPHCYKCEDSGEDHVDCPTPQPCPNKKCIETRAAIAAIDKGAKS